VDEIAFSMSTDNGLTWSMPIRVNQTPRSSTAQSAGVRRRRARHPKRNGRRDVLRLPEQHPGAGVRRTTGIVTAMPPARIRRAGRSESRLTTTSFDIEQAPRRGAVRVLPRRVRGPDEHRQRFVPVFVAVNNGNPANRTPTCSATRPGKSRLRVPASAGPDILVRRYRLSSDGGRQRAHSGLAVRGFHGLSAEPRDAATPASRTETGSAAVLLAAAIAALVRANIRRASYGRAWPTDFMIGSVHRAGLLLTPLSRYEHRVSRTSTTRVYRKLYKVQGRLPAHRFS
jgi:hypothetical protein